MAPTLSCSSTDVISERGAAGLAFPPRAHALSKGRQNSKRPHTLQCGIRWNREQQILPGDIKEGFTEGATLGSGVV